MPAPTMESLFGNDSEQEADTKPTTTQATEANASQEWPHWDSQASLFESHELEQGAIDPEPEPEPEPDPLPFRPETTVLHRLLVDEPYLKKWLPILAPDLFKDKGERCIFTAIHEHVTKYQSLPTKHQVSAYLCNIKGTSYEDYDKSLEQLKNITSLGGKESPQWMDDLTTTFFRSESANVAIMDLVDAEAGGKKSKFTVEQCLERISKAHSFTLAPTPGLTLNSKVLYEYLQSPNEKFPFDLDSFNRMAGGGLRRKRLATITGPTGLGKSLVLVHFTCSYLRQGLSVLYITLENSDVETLARIRANLNDIELDAQEHLSLADWDRLDQSVIGDGFGKLGDLRIREYPAQSAHAGHFGQYIKELKTKENFIPDVIVVDYLGLCLSKTLPHSKNRGAYEVLGGVVSELKGLATTHDALVLTAAQTNREGYDSEASLKNTGDSLQINSGSDFVMGVYLEEKTTGPDALMFKVLKYRNQKHNRAPFAVSVNSGKMKLIDDDPIQRFATSKMQSSLAAVQKSRKSTAPPHAKV